MALTSTANRASQKEKNRKKEKEKENARCQRSVDQIKVGPSNFMIGWLRASNDMIETGHSRPVAGRGTPWSGMVRYSTGTMEFFHFGSDASKKDE